MHICYIHGFLSGSAAVKSTILKNYIKESRPDLTFSAPDFPDTPKEAHDALIAYFEDLTKKYPEIGLVGSSMGGFFSTLLSGVFGFRSVLLNSLRSSSGLFSKFNRRSCKYGYRRALYVKAADA